MFAFITVSAWGQGVLFEHGFDELQQQGSYTDPGFSYNNCLINNPTGWTAMGWKGSCQYANHITLNAHGQLTNNAIVTYGELSSILSCTKTYPFYACGVNKIAHDYPDPNVHGFIYLYRGPNVFRPVVMNTDFGGGFYDIDVQGSKILVLGINDLTQSEAIVEYDTSGTYVGQLSVDSALAVRIIGKRSVLFFNDTALVLNSSLQYDTDVFTMVNGYKDALIEKDEHLLFLQQNGLVEVDTSLNVTRTRNLSSSVSDPKFLARSANGHIAVYGLHNGIKKMLVLSPAMIPIDSFIIDAACASVADISMNDSVIGITGSETFLRLPRGFVKTYDYSGATDNNADSLVISSAELVIDSLSVYNGNGVTVYNLNWHIDFVVKNLGSDTIKVFTMHTGMNYGSFCLSIYNITKYDSLLLGPGDSLNLSGSPSSSTFGDGDTLNFEREVVIRNVNHGIYNSTCPQPYVVRQTIVGIHDKPLPQTNINIYPNPSTGTYQIDDAPAASTLTVQDLQGRVVFMAEVHDKTTIDLSKQAHGMYLYTVTDKAGKRLATGKLLKH